MGEMHGDIKKLYHLGKFYLMCALWSSSISVTWELVRETNEQVSLQTYGIRIYLWEWVPGIRVSHVLRVTLIHAKG